MIRYFLLIVLESGRLPGIADSRRSQPFPDPTERGGGAHHRDVLLAYEADNRRREILANGDGKVPLGVVPTTAPGPVFPCL